MNGASTSVATNGYAKYQIRSTGMPRVLANETEVFSLDDADDSEDVKERRGVTKEEEKSRLFDCPLDSDEEKDKEEESDKGQFSRSNNIGATQKERSRLTDSFDLDADSLSDDLDLLPPLPGAPSTSSSIWSNFHRFHCCNPRIPSKCTIM
ncbi:unnamed protein product [Caenorhabditis auriculariae]|uniref:Uncharacterized protein n=1 Tax=Caenorhabditis auriculariae TaxID=2777116 RepID=A0A8S1HU19_9PELO|nr:unnamed protein product [Caenorhabditis auriculariae]